MDKTIDVIIPTYRPGKDFGKLLEMLVRQSSRPQSIIIMNSMENDADSLDVPDEARDLVQIHNIPKSEFDHGHTRNIAVGYSKADYFVCMTQDALPCDNNVLRMLVSSMSQTAAEAGGRDANTTGTTDDNVKQNGSGTEKVEAGMTAAEVCGRDANATGLADDDASQTQHGERIAMVYARQVPADDASEIETITRRFNYPDEDRIKTQRDLDEMGIKTFFASNVCCCYDRKVFDELGGFVDKTDFNEDMMYAAKLIKAGYAIKYCAGARVFHSHNYTARQQYERNKQLAISQVQHPEYFGGIKSESEGVKLVKNTASQLVKNGKWYKVPELIYMSGAKYLGYRAGRRKGTN